MDILHQKLILLESLAAKVEISKKSEISMILARFQANKPTPRFAAALVLELLSSKEEEAILDKEQKLMKQFGMSMAPGHNVRSFTILFGVLPPCQHSRSGLGRLWARLPGFLKRDIPRRVSGVRRSGT